MDSTTRTQIVVAAVNAAGPATAYTQTVQQAQPDGSKVDVVVTDPGGYQAAIHQHAVAITVMAGEESNLSKAIAAVSSAKVFAGTVLRVQKEATSTRGKITLHTGTDQVRDGIPPGCEQVRTERTDNRIGLDMARKVKGLIGHKVLVRVVVEEYNNGNGKVRVLHHIEDLGADPEFEKKQTVAAVA